MKDRPLPSNLETEREVIGTLLECSDIDEVHEYLVLLRVPCFFNQTYGQIFKYILNKVMNEKVLPSHASLITDFPMVDFEPIFSSGGLYFRMPDLIASLREMELRREIIVKCSQDFNNAYDTGNFGTSGDLINYLNESTNELVLKHHFRKATTTKDVLHKALGRIQDAAGNDGAGERVLYHHPVLDDLLTIYRKQVHSIGAFQGEGKTALALDCFLRQIKAGKRLMYFCTESAADELMLRIIANETGVSIEDLLCAGYTEPQMKNIINTFNEYFKLTDNFKIYGIGDFELRIDDIRSIVSKEARENGQIDMIYLDFLQDLTRPYGEKLDEREAIGYNVKGFKDIVVRNNCTGTMLCQFNQETHNQRYPNKKSFRGSGVIADASHIMSVLYKKEKEVTAKEVNEMSYYSVKTRLIKPWSRKVMFNGRKGEFTFTARMSDEDMPDYDKQIK